MKKRKMSKKRIAINIKQMEMAVRLIGEARKHLIATPAGQEWGSDLFAIQMEVWDLTIKIQEGELK